MENIIYNELKVRGYSVDVGVVKASQKGVQSTYEIDFVVNAKGVGERYYIQSALSADTSEKLQQKIRPFLLIKNDFTKRFLITKTNLKPWTDEYGIKHIGIFDFLLNNDACA